MHALHGGPELEIDVAEQFSARHGQDGPPERRAGIVDQDVHALELVFDLFPSQIQLMLLRYVAGHGDGSTAGPFMDFQLGFAQRAGRAREQGHVGSRSGEAQGDGLAESLARAGDHGLFI